MDFYAILDQVIALLRQRQRVTYRALKVQFQLHDEALEALKEELIEAQHLAADEAGRILVWIGDAAHHQRQVRHCPSQRRSRTPMLSGHQPHLTHRKRNAASLRCCFVTWWTRLRSPASSTRKSSARWCGPIKRPRPGDRPR